MSNTKVKQANIMNTQSMEEISNQDVFTVNNGPTTLQVLDLNMDSIGTEGISILQPMADNHSILLRGEHYIVDPKN